MHWAFFILLPVYVIVCLFLILVILLQAGKGGGLSSLMGAGSSLADSIGATSLERTMNRWTTYCAIGFGVLAIAMTLIGRIGANPSSIYDEIGGDDSSLLAPAPDAEEQGAVSPDVDAPTPSLDVELPAEPGQAPSAAEAPEMPPDGGLSAAPAADKTPAAASDAP